MEPSGGTVEVRSEATPGLPASLDACPVGGLAGVPPAGSCVPLEPGRTVVLDLGQLGPHGSPDGPSGVLVRVRDSPPAALRGVVGATLGYRPSSESLTVVTPAVPTAGTSRACSGEACQVSLKLVPTGSGTFRLDAEGAGARPRFTLLSAPPPGGGRTTGSRVLSLVEGGGRLAVRSTVEAGSSTELRLENVGEAELPALELAISWPIGG